MPLKNPPSPARIRASRRNGLLGGRPKRVVVDLKDGDWVRDFPSITKAAEFLGLSKQRVHQMCRDGHPLVKYAD